MIKPGVNYVNNPEAAKRLTREELIQESNRLETLSFVFSDRDYEASDEYLRQAKVLDGVLLDMMVQDDIEKELICPIQKLVNKD